MKKAIYLIILFLIISLYTQTTEAANIDPASGNQLQDVKSRDYLINGIYYLICQQNHYEAEEQFRNVIFSSPFKAFTDKSNDYHQDKYVVAEAFYFLGRIYYQKAISQGDIEQNIASAKMYLMKAEDFGLIHDQLHPSLLDEVNQKYPNISPLVSELTSGKASTVFELDNSSYQIDAVQIDRNLDVKKATFSTNKKLTLDGGKIYKMEPNINNAYKSIYNALIAVGIAITVLLIRN